jgi:hypothetical protein
MQSDKVFYTASSTQLANTSHKAMYQRGLSKKERLQYQREFDQKVEKVVAILPQTPKVFSLSTNENRECDNYNESVRGCAH